MPPLFIPSSFHLVRSLLPIVPPVSIPSIVSSLRRLVDLSPSSLFTFHFFLRPPGAKKAAPFGTAFSFRALRE